MSKIKVYVIDDSAVVRQTVGKLLEQSEDLELIGVAANPLVAVPALKKNRPDVLLLDIEMPGMDGLTFLRKLMAEDPIPTVICSTLTEKGSRTAFEAMSAGAVAVVGKPALGVKQFLLDAQRDLLQALRSAAMTKPKARAPSPSAPSAHSAAVPIKANDLAVSSPSLALNRPVVIGGSTGGTQAIEQILCSLPADAPGIAITQHMPEKFTAMYAQRLNTLCAMQVREARDGDRLERGVALIAPGGRHMQVTKSVGQYFVRVMDGPTVNRHKPSVDVLFKSAAAAAGGDVLGILLTGMGDDGARGLKALKDGGAMTIAQDEESCVVFGMPMEAIKLGAAVEILPLGRIADSILRFDRRQSLAE